MIRRLKIALPAKAEIIGIWDYTAAKHGPAAADAYVTDLDTVMLRLLDYPLLGEDCSDIRQGYRRIYLVMTQTWRSHLKSVYFLRRLQR